MNIKISVIIPTLNRVNFLPNCIKSILSQTYPADEIILVDNKSTDGTVNYIKDKFKMVKILIEKKKGVSSARNLGIVRNHFSCQEIWQ